MYFLFIIKAFYVHYATKRELYYLHWIFFQFLSISNLQD